MCIASTYLSDISHKCEKCTVNSVVNTNKDGCDCTGPNTEWMKDCNTCECILSAYNNSHGVCELC